MAALQPFLTLSVTLLLALQAFGKNDVPCQRSKWNNGYNIFIKRHIPTDIPDSLDQNEWNRYIIDKTGCERPTQSFLSQKDLERVKEVCTSRGGKVYEDNLCISQEPFTFVTVRSEKGTCGIKSVRKETKHLILACEVLDNQCLPVHFEGNSKNLKPNNNARGCQDKQTAGHAPGVKATWLCLLSVFLLLIYGC
ncbi:uncharacterized protein V6R79_010092 [Siganus canaliculatus]